jgi:hypothetical protein
MAEKFELIKQLKHLYNAPKDPIVVEVPPLNFLMIDGHGDPNQSPTYQEAVEGIFSLAYTLKFAIKKAEGIDYSVLPLEGLWWVEDMDLFSIEDKSNWDWTMMIAQPEFVNLKWVDRARVDAFKKKGLAVLDRIRFEPYVEGLSAQLMHTGPYAAEESNIVRLHKFIIQQGCERSGKHHEIYLSDVRRTAPEKLRTIIRQPMKHIKVG